jgi:hypothetical protein
MNFPLSAVLGFLALTPNLNKFLDLVELGNPQRPTLSQVLIGQTCDNIHNIHVKFVETAVLLNQSSGGLVQNLNVPVNISGVVPSDFVLLLALIIN